MAEHDSTRTEGFSDGVFTIAITLLGLDLKVPYEARSTSALAEALLAKWPSYLAFVLGFVTILIIWTNDHRIFDLIERVDTQLKFANGFLLLLVAAIPFATALVSAFLKRPGANLAVAVYCAMYFLLNIAFNLLRFSATRSDKKLVAPRVTPQHAWAIQKRLLVGLPVYAAAFFIALMNAVAGLIIASSLWVVWTRSDYHSLGPGKTLDGQKTES